MSDLVPREAITEARFAIRHASKIEPGRYALESAFLRLGDALAALDKSDVEYAQGAVAEAIELLGAARITCATLSRPRLSLLACRSSNWRG